MKGLHGLITSFQILFAFLTAAAMGMAANDIRTSEADSVASTATARVVEIDGGDPRHHRKLYRSETRLGTDEVAGESFQVGSVFDLDYLASLHGIAALRGKVDQKQSGLLQMPRMGKQQSAVDRKIKVGGKDESEEREDDDERESPSEATAAAPFSRLPHKYDTQPTSLYATHTYVDPNLDLSVVDTAAASNSVNDDLIAQLKTLLRLRLQEEEEEEEEEGSNLRKKEISELDAPPPGSFTPIQVNPPGSAPRTSPSAASPKVNYRQPKSNRLELKNIAPLNTVSFNRGDTFVASKKLSESAPPATPATLFPLFGNPELQQIPSQPTYTNYGVAVDFAGATDDNPLYRGRRPDEDNDDGDNRSVGSAVNIGVLGLGVASDVGVAIDQVSGSVVPPTDLYRVQSESPGREQRQPIRPYSPSYNDAIYDDSWPQSAPGDASSGRNVNRESEYYYKGVEDYPPTPDYNALHYQSSRDRNYGEGHHKRYQEEERNQYGGEGHRDRYADDSDFGNHDHRAFHDNRDRDENRDIGALDYHDQVRAPRPPRDQNPNAGKSFPDNYDGDDAEEGGSAFRQFFAGDGLAAPPPKRVRESHERRDRDRDRGRDRESSKDRKRRERNKSKPDKRKRRPPPRPKKKKKEKKKDPKTLQHLQSDKSRERNKDKKRENPRGKRRPSDAPQKAKDEPRDFDHGHDDDYEDYDDDDEYDEEDYDSKDDETADADITTRMSNIMGKIMGDAYGDNQFDFYDFIPLLVVLVGSAVLVAGLFPTGFSGITNLSNLSTLGLTNGNIVIGRRDRKVDGSVGFSGTMSEALDRFENGIMMVSAIRHDEDCAERFACRLGEIARGSLDIGGGEWATLMNSLDMGGGSGGSERSAYGNMTRSFERVARGLDDSGACQRKCNRCIAL